MKKEWLGKALMASVASIALALLFSALAALLGAAPGEMYTFSLGELLSPLPIVLLLSLLFLAISAFAVLASQVIASIRVLALVQGGFQKLIWLAVIWLGSLLGTGIFYLLDNNVEFDYE